MALTSFAGLQQFLNNFVQNNNINIASAQHAAFWNNLSYSDFINGNVPGVQDPNTGNAVPILNKINGRYDGPSSNLVTVLSGTNTSIRFRKSPTGSAHSVRNSRPILQGRPRAGSAAPDGGAAVALGPRSGSGSPCPPAPCSGDAPPAS
jgi:hypothetical protein